MTVRGTNRGESLVTTHKGQGRAIILYPIDIGKSYIFHVSDDEKQSINKTLKGDSSQQTIQAPDTIAHAWKKFFEGDPTNSWDFSPLPKFGSPRGPLTRLQLDLKKERKLHTELKKFPGIRPEEIEAFFFPLGIGVLVVRATLTDSAETALDGFSDKRDELRARIGKELQEIGGRFNTVLSVSASRNSSLTELTAVRRNAPAEAAYSFPIVIVDPSKYGDLKDRDIGYLGMGDEESESKVRDYKYYLKKEHSAQIFVGWTEAYACNNPPSSKSAEDDTELALIANFVVGMTSWYALRVMERIASAYLLGAFKQIASGNKRNLKEISSAMRLTFMDAANASHPIRWTGWPQDLGLLEYINGAWSSLRLREAVEEKTKTLATHHNQLEEEEREERNFHLSLFGIAFACLTLASAVSDITGMLPHTSLFRSFRHNDWVLGIVLPIDLALVLAFWMYMRTRQKRREPFRWTRFLRRLVRLR